MNIADSLYEKMFSMVSEMCGNDFYRAIKWLFPKLKEKNLIACRGDEELLLLPHDGLGNLQAGTYPKYQLDYNYDTLGEYGEPNKEFEYLTVKGCIPLIKCTAETLSKMDDMIGELKIDYASYCQKLTQQYVDKWAPPKEQRISLEKLKQKVEKKRKQNEERFERDTKKARERYEQTERLCQNLFAIAETPECIEMINKQLTARAVSTQQKKSIVCSEQVES